MAVYVRRARNAKGRRVKAINRRAAQGGFSLIEVLIGIVVLAIVAGAIAQGFASSSATIGRSRVDSAASTLASARLDQTHRAPYEDVGTVGGNPPGVFVADETRTVSGTQYAITTSVEFVDDPALGQPRTYVNYKKVTVTVTPQVPNPKPITETTVISPPSFGAIAGKATAVITVRDPIADEPLSGVWVTVDGSTSAPRTARTDSTGVLVFAGLDPSNPSPASPLYEYRASATLAGYVTHPTTSPTKTRAHLAASQTWNTEIQMFKPARIAVNLYDKATDTIIDDPASVTVTLPAIPTQTETRTGSTGSFVFDTVAGGAIEPSESNTTVSVSSECYAAASPQTGPVPETGYPTTTSRTFTFELEPIPHGNLKVTVVRYGTSAPISTAQVTVSGGPAAPTPATRSVNSSGYVSYCLPPSGATNYAVQASAPGYSVGHRYAAIANGGDTPLTVILVPAASTGTIRVNATGSGLTVRLTNTSFGYDFYSLTTSSGPGPGHADFTGLAPGTYSASVATAFSGGQPTAWSAPAKSVTLSGSSASVSVP
jgi:prepilin-type N-terminal cleavage/methylation domain-containing protein